MCRNRPSRWERVLRAVTGIDINLERIEARMGAFEDKVELLGSKVDLLIARGNGSAAEVAAAEARAEAAEAAAAKVVADDASEDAAADQARGAALDGLIAIADEALAPAAEEAPVEEAAPEA